MKALVVLLVLACGSTAAARSETYVPDGFLLRFTTGVGYTAKSVQHRNEGVDGYTIDASIALGWAIITGLSVHAEGWIGGPFSNDEGSIGSRGLALGLTYTAPTNTFAALAGGKAFTTLVGPDFGGVFHDETRGSGPCLTAMLGQLWWLSPQWSFGIAGRFVYSDIDVSDELFGELDGHFLSLTFSVTAAFQ